MNKTVSFRITRITVGKGRTVSDEKQGAWNKQYLEVEATVEDERDVEQAKNSIESLLDLWLNGQTVRPKQDLNGKKGSTDLPYDPDMIPWQDREGPKGPFQISEDYVNANHQALLRFLSEHTGGCMSSKDWFYWKFNDDRTIGRKMKHPAK